MADFFDIRASAERQWKERALKAERALEEAGQAPSNALLGLLELARWKQRALEAEGALARVMKAPPAQMSTPLGLLPVNSEGMRRLMDELVGARVALAELSKGLDAAGVMLEELKRVL